MYHATLPYATSRASTVTQYTEVMVGNDALPATQTFRRRTAELPRAPFSSELPLPTSQTLPAPIAESNSEGSVYDLPDEVDVYLVPNDNVGDDYQLMPSTQAPPPPKE